MTFTLTPRVRRIAIWSAIAAAITTVIACMAVAYPIIQPIEKLKEGWTAATTTAPHHILFDFLHAALEYLRMVGGLLREFLGGRGVELPPVSHGEILDLHSTPTWYPIAITIGALGWWMLAIAIGMILTVITLVAGPLVVGLALTGWGYAPNNNSSPQN